MIDPLSASLQHPEIEMDRMPVKDFEKGLECSGILGKAGKSCFSFVKPDSDGNIGVDELQVLEKYDNASSPEHLEELREGLIAAFDSLHDAFKVLVGSDHGTLSP